MKADVILIRNAASDDFGGAERYVVFLAEELRKQQLRSLILSAHTDILQFASQQMISNQASPWLKQQNWYGKRALLFPLFLIWQLRLIYYYYHQLKKSGARVIHPQSRDDFIAATYAGKLLKRRVIWTDHADLKHIFKNTANFGRNWLGKMVLAASKKADRIILNSYSDAKAIAKSVNPKHPFWRKTVIIHNGSSDQLASYPKQEQKDSKFTFITNCRIVKDKGLGETIRAFKQLYKKHPNIKLVIMGDGPDRPKFEKLAHRHSAITFFGHQDDPIAFLAQANCFVQATYHEGLSLSLVEACMMQKPIITTDVGGNPEVIQNHKNGLLVPAKNILALREAMDLILNNPKLANKLAKNARRSFLKQFNFSELVAEYIIPIYNGKNVKSTHRH